MQDVEAEHCICELGGTYLSSLSLAKSKSQQGEARRERAFESALGLSNVRAKAFDERTGSPAHEFGSHRHRRRR